MSQPQLEWWFRTESVQCDEAVLYSASAICLPIFYASAWLFPKLAACFYPAATAVATVGILVNLRSAVTGLCGSGISVVAAAFHAIPALLCAWRFRTSVQQDADAVLRATTVSGTLLTALMWIYRAGLFWPYPICPFDFFIYGTCSSLCAIGDCAIHRALLRA